MSFLLDTDTCSAHLKGKTQVTNRLLQYTGRLHLSTISLGELYAWAARANAPPSRLPSFNDLLREVTVLALDEPAAYKFGELRAASLDQGQPAPLLDLFIAATALVHGLTVVTHNVQDFANVPGLQVVDWLAP